MSQSDFQGPSLMVSPDAVGNTDEAASRVACPSAPHPARRSLHPAPRTPGLPARPRHLTAWPPPVPLEVAAVCPCDTPPPRGVAPPASLHKQRWRRRSVLVCRPLTTRQLVLEAGSCSLPQPAARPPLQSIPAGSVGGTPPSSPVRALELGPSPALRPRPWARKVQVTRELEADGAAAVTVEAGQWRRPASDYLYFRVLCSRFPREPRSESGWG